MKRNQPTIQKERKSDLQDEYMMMLQKIKKIRPIHPGVKKIRLAGRTGRKRKRMNSKCNRTIRKKCCFMIFFVFASK